jgi:BirA family biotin operon repressor/biotin-[acetyl-CoA-carboxylase] ligase
MDSTTPWRIILLDETDSTNRIMIDRFAPVSLDRLVIVADHQVAGRGRRGRGFYDVPRSLLACSVLVRLPKHAAINLLPLAVGNAAVLATRALGASGIELKWPNDLMIAGAKLGGILVEGSFKHTTFQGVLGLGINLTATPTLTDARVLSRLVDVIDDRASEGFFSLRDALLTNYLRELDSQIRQLLCGRTELLLASYRGLCSTLGCRVRIQRPEGEVVGLAEDVDQEGCLVVDTAGGRVAVHVGDVEHLGIVDDL